MPMRQLDQADMQETISEHLSEGELTLEVGTLTTEREEARKALGGVESGVDDDPNYFGRQKETLEFRGLR